MEQKRTTHRSPGFLYAMIMIGAGLILLGAVLFVMMASPDAAVRADEFSTIPIETNRPAPELNLTDLQGKSVSLDDYLGKVVLVNIWATWCPPCKAEMPTLQAFNEKYKDDGFIIIGINDGETADLVGPFVQRYKLTFPIWLDEKYLSERAFKTNSLPSSYVIDREGTVRLMWIGGITARVLEKYVPALIKE